MNEMNDLKEKLARLTQNRLELGRALARQQDFVEIEFLQQSCAHLDHCITKTRAAMALLAGKMWAETLEAPVYHG